MKYVTFFLLLAFLGAQCRQKKDALPAVTITDTLGLKWATVERDNITYCFQDLSYWSDAGKYFMDAHEAAYIRINSVFKAELPRKLRFYIWTDPALGAQVLNRSVGFANTTDCICHIRTNQSFGHEMTHVLSYWAGGITPTYKTRFINEGVAVAFDQNSGNRITKAKAAISGQNIHSVLDVWQSGNSYSEAVLYPLAGAFVEFLYQRGSLDQFLSVIRNQSIQTAESTYGKPKFDSLVREFEALVGIQ